MNLNLTTNYPFCTGLASPLIFLKANKPVYENLRFHSEKLTQETFTRTLQFIVNKCSNDRHNENVVGIGDIAIALQLIEKNAIGEILEQAEEEYPLSFVWVWDDSDAYIYKCVRYDALYLAVEKMLKIKGKKITYKDLLKVIKTTGCDL